MRTAIAKEPDGPRRVLVYDDERHIVRLIQVNLERQGHEVVGVFTGAEALARIIEQPFDLAIIDLSLPDMSGREVIRRIRENPATSHIHLILLADKEDQDHDQHPPGSSGPGGEPVLYLTKPFHPMQLISV